MTYLPMLSRLRNDTAGAAVLELAIASPFLILALVGLVDLGRGFAERATLHSAVARTIEVAQARSNMSDYDALVDEGASASGLPKENVLLAKWLECSGTKKDFDGTCGANEETARFIELKIVATYKSVIGNDILGLKNGIQIYASESLRVQ